MFTILVCGRMAFAVTDEFMFLDIWMHVHSVHLE